MTTDQHRGFWPTMRARLFGEHDAVGEQMKDLARQGSGMARVAHACSLLLIILFSAGSLIALSGEALASILSQWQHSGMLDIPAIISVAVSTLLVLAMDTAMLYAASVLRVMNARRADASEKRLHQLVMGVVAILEAATYAYMSATYDHPSSAVAWALILARAGAAPLLAVYLSMARPLPVTSRDILAQAELASGMGVLRDVVNVANDTDATLDAKMRLYGASAVMQPTDATRLDGMIAAVSYAQAQAKTPAKALPDRAYTQRPASGLYVPQTLNTSGVKPRSVRSDTDAVGDEPPDAPPDGASRQRQSRSPLPFRKSRVAVKRSPERIAFDLLDATPDASDNTIMRAAHVGRERAKQLRTEWQTQRAQEAQG